jgi:hypothetical protein
LLCDAVEPRRLRKTSAGIFHFADFAVITTGLTPLPPGASVLQALVACGGASRQVFSNLPVPPEQKEQTLPMSRYDEQNFQDRLSSASKARQSLLAKFKKDLDDPARIERQREREAIVAARVERQAQKEAARREHERELARQAEAAAAAAAEAARIEAEKAAREAAELAALEAQIKAEEAEREAQLNAEQKAARDARYAARKAAKKERRRGY